MKSLFVSRGVFLFLAIVYFLLARKPQPVDRSLATYTGKIEEYRGNKKLIVVFTASWASVWNATSDVLQQLDFARFDLRIVDEATERAVIKQQKITLLPMVALIQDGKIIKSVPNLASIDQISDW